MEPHKEIELKEEIEVEIGMEWEEIEVDLVVTKVTLDLQVVLLVKKFNFDRHNEAFIIKNLIFIK